MKLKLLLILFFSVATGVLQAQEAMLQPVNGILSARVRTMIEMDHRSDRYNNSNPVDDGLPGLATVLHTKARIGRIPAYSLTSDKLATVMSPRDVALEIKQSLIDTEYGTDPLTGKAFVRTMTYGADHDELPDGLMILTEWRLDIKKRTTELQIIAVAPKLKGKTARYWLKYDDVKAVIAAYETQYPNSSLKASLWEQYFKAANTSRSDFTNTCMRLVYLGDSLKNGIRKKNTLGEILTPLILTGKLKAYTTYTSNPNDSWDPASLRQKTGNVNYANVRTGKLREEWSFDAATGTSHITITDLALFKDEYIEQTRVNREYLYWVMFPDIPKALDEYDGKHPDETFEWALWQSYFTTKNYK